jgi:hypothetical protein
VAQRRDLVGNWKCSPLPFVGMGFFGAGNNVVIDHQRNQFVIFGTFFKISLWQGDPPRGHRFRKMGNNLLIL